MLDFTKKINICKIEAISNMSLSHFKHKEIFSNSAEYEYSFYSIVPGCVVLYAFNIDRSSSAIGRSVTTCHKVHTCLPAALRQSSHC